MPHRKNATVRHCLETKLAIHYKNVNVVQIIILIKTYLLDIKRMRLNIFVWAYIAC
jgi:hypothetical protein